MPTAIRLHLRNFGQPLVDAWEREFAGIDGVEISSGDIFSMREGMLPNDAPIDVEADAIVSPANSFGYMNGGIDAVYTHQLGLQVQERAQQAIVRDFGGELPVGAAIIVPTSNAQIPWCICAPTMRYPTEVSETLNAYVAMRACLRAALAHNNAGQPRIETILCPGLATGVGRMPVDRCARQMRVAWERELGGKPWFPRSLGEAAADEAYLLCQDATADRGHWERQRSPGGKR